MNSKPYKLPWALTCAVLTTFVALYLRSGNLGVLPFLAVGLLATYVMPARIPHASWAPWVLRIVAYGWLSNTTGHPDEGGARMFSEGTIDLFGTIWAIECVFQAWRERPFGNPPGASVIGLSALAFVAAATTPDESALRFTAPAYFVFVLIALRQLNRQTWTRIAQPSDPQDPSARRTAVRVRIGQLAGAAMALGLGYGGYLAMYTHKDQLMTVGNTPFQHRPPPESVGLSTAPSLGDSFNMEGSPTRVLRIEGHLADPHLRGLTFDLYRRGSWLPPLESRRFVDASAADLRSNAPGSKTRVHVLADGLNILVAPMVAKGIKPVDSFAVEHLAGYGGTFQTEEQAPYRYDIVQAEDSAPGPFEAPPSPAELKNYLDVPPEIAAGVRELARELGDLTPSPSPSQGEGGKSGAGSGAPLTPEEKVAAVDQYLLSHYSYSLSYHPKPGDKVSEFLLHGKAAHCEYFASSATILLRLMGVPTRYATGYYAHETAADGSTVVRQRDSHAWAESWIDGKGWITVDATPGGGRPDKLYPDTPPMWRIWEWLADRLQDARDALARYTPMQITGSIGLIALAVFGLRLLMRRRKRVATVPEPGYSVEAQIREISERFEALMARSGVTLPPAQTWTERINDGVPEPLDTASVSRFVKLYNELRFRSPATPVLSSQADQLTIASDRSPATPVLSSQADQATVALDRLRADTLEALSALEKGSKTDGHRH